MVDFIFCLKNIYLLKICYNDWNKEESPIKHLIIALILSILFITGCASSDNGESHSNGQQEEPNNNNANENNEEKPTPNGNNINDSANNEQEKDDNVDEPNNNDEEKTSDDEDFAIPVNVPEDMIFEGMILTDGSINVRAEPNTNSERLTQLRDGTHIFILIQENGWSYVLAGDVEGWVSNIAIKEIPYDSTQKYEVVNPDDLLVLVNKTYRLPSDYEPDDLIIPDVPFPFDGSPEWKHLRREAAHALEDVFAAAKEEGLEIYATSGYRSFAIQKQLFPNNVKNRGFEKANETSAFPGESEHQTGLAIDVSSRAIGFRLTPAFGETAEGKWVHDNAHKFGYIIRYEEGTVDTTGYTYEPWHLRYVGQKAAREIKEQGVTLEKYLGK